jgi:hypothetical protein
MRNIREYIIMDRHSATTDTFTAAVTDICTQSAHGLKNGDPLVLTTADTLPAGLALATVYYVIEATTNTFKLSLTPCPTYTTGTVPQPVPEVDITDTGTGAHTYTMHDIGRNIDVSEFRHCIVAVHGAGSTDGDIGFVGSIGKSATDDACPDFSAAATATNSWTYIDIVGLINGTSVDGSATSIAFTGSATHTMWEVNINGLKWLNAIVSGWTAGTMTIFIRLFND